VWRRATLIRKAGLHPIADVEFKQFPAPLLRAAVDKGEAHAVADGDPNTYLWLNRDRACRGDDEPLDWPERYCRPHLLLISTISE
jgi:ABC-type nitrate/sulfonate/bicarbonate transport system substrate-binding protein